MLTKATYFGLGREEIDEFDGKRCVKPEEDLYPPALMSSCPSMKMEGIARLIYACAYGKLWRIKELLREYYTDPETDLNILEKNIDYGFDLHSSVFSSNMLDNIMYSDNREMYHDVLFCLLTNLSPEDVANFVNRSIHGLVGNYRYQNHLGISMSHYIPVILNYGYQPTEEDIERIKDNEGLKTFLSSKLCQRIVSSELLPGKKYEEILSDTVCPITRERINKPAITPDGHIFEKEAIIDYLSTAPNRSNPATGIEFMENIVYLPDESRFIMVEYKKSRSFQMFAVAYHESFRNELFRDGRRTLTLEVYPETTIKELRRIIGHKLTGKSRSFPGTIKYGDVQLDDHRKTMEEYKIRKESSVHINL